MKKNIFIIATLLLVTNASMGRDWGFNATNGSAYHKMFISGSIGAQTFIGNELVSSARYSGFTPCLSAEWGYRLTPEISISFRLMGHMIKGQSLYGGSPLIDPSISPTEYKSFSMYGGSIVCLLTLDWTNIIIGYNYRQKPFHILMPVGMGISALAGKNVNPYKTDSYPSVPLNKEFCFIGGLKFDYQISQRVALFLEPQIVVARGSIDYSPGTNEKSMMDLMPSISLGIRYDLMQTLKWITQ